VRTTGVALLAALLTSLFAGAGATVRGSGLRGIVMRGPTRPVCRANESCEAPARGLVLRFVRDGVVKAEVKTSRTGSYAVTLRSGRYAVKLAVRRPGTGLTPRVVRVPKGRIARVDFHLDTGIQ
jgi:hypothetical protein